MVRLASFAASIAVLPIALCAAFAPSAQKSNVAQNLVSNVMLSPQVASPSAPIQQAPLTEMSAMLTQTELPEKLYFEKEKEMPKVLGGLKIGTRELVVVTGASSGLGLNAAATLAKTGRYFVVMACRDVEKAKKGEY